MITVSAISYFSVINAATLSSVPDTASSYTTDICEPTIVAQETVLFILSNANTEKSTQDDLSVTDGNIHYIGPDETWMVQPMVYKNRTHLYAAGRRNHALQRMQ